MFKKNLYFIAICFFISLISCSDDDQMAGTDGCPEPATTYQSGVFVIHEGPFQTGTGTLSFVDESSNEQSHLIYQNANCDDIIGNILQSVTHVDNRLYFVVNNAEKIIITDDEKIDKIGEITGLKLPRRLLKLDESTAYVTEWESLDAPGNIAVVNLDNLEIESTIPAGNGPEYLIHYEDKIYVSNAGNRNRDSVVLIINPLTHEVEKTLVVGDNPNSFQIDKNGDLWVSCFGYAPDFDVEHPDAIQGSLVRINNESIQEVISLDFLGAQKMEINPAGDLLYFLQGGYSDLPVYTFDIDAKIVSDVPLIDVAAYGMGVNPDNGHLYIGDAKGFGETGEISEFDETGALIQSFFSSIGPNGFIFK